MSKEADNEFLFSITHLEYVNMYCKQNKLLLKN